MQTGLQSFDLSVLGASPKGQKAMPAITKANGDDKSNQVDGFLEIMSALLALPPEQWKSSLAELDAVPSDGDAASFPCPIGNTEKNVNPAELLALLMNMKGAVLQELQSAEAETEAVDKLEPLLDVAKALMDDPQMAALGSAVAGNETLKAQWDQVEKAVQDGPGIDLGEKGQIRLFPGLDNSKEKSKDPVAVEINSEDKTPSDAPPALKSAALGKDTSGTLSQPNPVEDFLFQTSDAQKDSAPSQGFEKVKSSLAAGAANTPVTDSLPDEKSLPAGKEHQLLAAADVKRSGPDAQSHANGDNLEERLTQRLVAPTGTHQGVLSRSETGKDMKGMTVSGNKEVMPQDKPAQSDVIRQIVQRMSMQTIGAQSKMVIRLKPEFLGNVHMHVLTENHQVTVRMMADSTMVKDIVEQNIQHLRAELLHHGLEIQKFDVFVANDEQGWRGRQEQAGFRDNTGQKRSRSDGGKSKNRREKVAFDTGRGQKIVQKDPSEIDYFA